VKLRFCDCIFGVPVAWKRPIYNIILFLGNISFHFMQLGSNWGLKKNKINASLDGLIFDKVGKIIYSNFPIFCEYFFLSPVILKNVQKSIMNYKEKVVTSLKLVKTNA
jgi:hypothetical protein